MALEGLPSQDYIALLMAAQWGLAEGMERAQRVARSRGQGAPLAAQVLQVLRGLEAVSASPTLALPGSSGLSLTHASSLSGLSFRGWGVNATSVTAQPLQPLQPCGLPDLLTWDQAACPGDSSSARRLGLGLGLGLGLLVLCLGAAVLGLWLRHSQEMRYLEAARAVKPLPADLESGMLAEGRKTAASGKEAGISLVASLLANSSHIWPRPRANDDRPVPAALDLEGMSTPEKQQALTEVVEQWRSGLIGHEEDQLIVQGLLGKVAGGLRFQPRVEANMPFRFLNVAYIHDAAKQLACALLQGACGSVYHGKWKGMVRILWNTHVQPCGKAEGGPWGLVAAWCSWMHACVQLTWDSL